MPPTSRATPTLDATAAKAPESQTALGPRSRPKLPGNQAMLRIQRKCSCGGLGKCEACGRLQDAGVQMKPLRSQGVYAGAPVGPRDDAFEREADATAERIMRMTASDRPLSANRLAQNRNPQLQGKPVQDTSFQASQKSLIQRADGASDDEEIEGSRIQRKAAATGLTAADAAASHRATTVSSAGDLTSGGEPLPHSIRTYFESRFGHDFSSVRTHSGEDAERSNEDMGSAAFTFGTHIWLGRDESVAQTALLAHELTHVIQQIAPPLLDSAASQHPHLHPTGQDNVTVSGANRPELVHADMHERDTIERKLDQEQEEPRLQRRIQRQPKSDPLPPSANVFTVQFGNGFALVQTPALGRGTLYYQDRAWINFKWDASKSPDERKLTIDLKADIDAPIPRLTLKINVDFRVELQVNQSTEQFMTDRAALSISTHGGKLEVAIDAGGSGELNTFPPGSGPARSEPLPAKTLTAYSPTPGSEDQPVIVGGEGDRPAPAPPTSPDAPAALLESTQQVWIQKDQSAFEDFAKKHPDTNWAGITLPDGRVVAFALTEGALQSAAERIRVRDYRLPFQAPFPGSHVTGVVLHGKVLQSINEIENLYYSEDLAAAVGIEGDYQEAEVFEMAGHSFGRKPLTHAQAVARWKELDALPIDPLRKLETEAGHKFSLLWVKGLADLHALDIEYFTARAKLLALPQVTPGWLIDPTDPMMRVLQAEADREDVSAPVRGFLEKNEPTATVLQEKIVSQAEITGNALAVRALNKAMDPFERIVNSDADAAVFLMTLAETSESNRREILASLGYGKLAGGVTILVVPSSPESLGTALGTQLILSEEFTRTMRVTSSRANALRITLGETIEGTSLKSIRERARGTRDEFKRTINSLGDPQNPTIKILYHEGDLGQTVRLETYRAMGFNTLKAADYPHSGQTKGLLPGPMSAGSFASIAEQMFANYSANHATVEDLKLAAEIAAAIVITILSDGLGAAVAEEYFAGSAVARTVISGATFTLLDAGVQGVIHGKSPVEPNNLGGSAAKLGEQVVLNIAMFAFFKQLDTVFSAFSRSGVRAVLGLSEEAFLASRLAIRSANVVRLSGLSAFFVTLSFDQFVISNGRLPTPREAARLAIKSVVSIAALEVAGSLIKATQSEGGFWGRTRKLDIKTPERNALFDRVRGVNSDLLSTNLEPAQVNAKSDALAARYEAILQDQRKLVNDAKPELSAKGDEAGVKQDADDELARIDASLDALHQAKLIARADIAPAGDPANPSEATEFTYSDTPATRKSIVDQFGESKTKVDKDGVITVNRADGVQLIIRPAPAAQAGAANTFDQQGTTPSDPKQPVDKPTAGPEKAEKDNSGKPDIPADEGQQKQDQNVETPAGKATGSQADLTPDFFTRRDALVTRRSVLLRRAAATGVLDPVPDFGPGSVRARPQTKAEVAQRLAAQNAIRNVIGRQPSRIRTAKGLAQQEAEIAAAEKAAKPELDRLADLAFARHRERLERAGLSMDKVRTGSLSNLTDLQIGEALAEVPTAQGLNEAQLRGILFAAYGKPGDFIDIRAVFDLAGSAAERNAVLEFFAKLMDQGVPGTYEVLQTMTTSRNNWRGGIHVLDFAVNGTGGTNVVAFEFPEALSETGDVSEGGRIYDIILGDGTRIQCKNWRNWFGVRSQFRRDILLQTDHFGNTNGLAKIRWIFRGPSPKAPAEIREIMRQTLEDTMEEFKVAPEARVRLRDVFAGHTGLVEEWNGTSFSGSAAAPPATTPPPIPATTAP